MNPKKCLVLFALAVASLVQAAPLTSEMAYALHAHQWETVLASQPDNVPALIGATRVAADAQQWAACLAYFARLAPFRRTGIAAIAYPAAALAFERTGDSARAYNTLETFANFMRSTRADYLARNDNRAAARAALVPLAPLFRTPDCADLARSLLPRPAEKP